MKHFLLILAVALLISCGNKAKSNDSNNTTDSTSVPPPIESNYPTDSLKGEYIGSFGNSTIIIVLNFADGKKASGYDIVQGNRRNIHGDVVNKGSYFHFELSEPGGDKYDGNFSFSIDTATRTMEGKWTPYDSTKAKSKNFKLTKRHPKHFEREGCVGTWHMNGLAVEFNKDQSGIAKGNWSDEKIDSDEEVEIPFSWFADKKFVSIEWKKNKIFKSSKMKFKIETDEFEEMLQCDDYIMYRY